MAVAFAVDNQKIQGLQDLAGTGAGLGSGMAFQPSGPQPMAPTIQGMSGP